MASSPSDGLFVPSIWLRLAREEELRVLVDSAFRLGGAPAVHDLANELREAVPCPLCHGRGVVQFDEVQVAAFGMVYGRGFKIEFRCLACNGGRILPHLRSTP